MAGRTEQTTEPTDRERWAAAASWSHRPSLDPLETTLWRSERPPALSATNCVVILLDKEPGWARFRAAHEWGTQLVRRLRQRVLEPAVPTTCPIWVDDDRFDLDHHLTRRPVGGAGELADVLHEAQEIALTVFDRTRPLWEGTLLTGLSGGGAAYVLKIHHVLADTPGTVQLVSMLASRTRRHTADKPVASADSPAPAPDPMLLAAQGAAGEIAAAPGRALTAAGKGLAALRDPLGAVSTGLRYAASVRRLAASAPAPASPLFTERDGSSWHYLTFTAPLEEMAAAGRRVGGSLQDAFVAALLGGLRRHHDAHGTTVGDLPVSIRVSLDRGDDPTSGNRFAGAIIAGPAGIVDPTERIAAVRGEALSLHTESALDALRAAAPLTSRLPSGLVAALHGVGAVADASVAVNSGPARTAYMAGARVEAMYAFGPLPGVALSASLLSYADTACIGVNADGCAVSDLSVLQRCLQEGLDEVCAVSD